MVKTNANKKGILIFKYIYVSLLFFLFCLESLYLITNVILSSWKRFRLYGVDIDQKQNKKFKKGISKFI